MTARIQAAISLALAFGIAACSGKESEVGASGGDTSKEQIPAALEEIDVPTAEEASKKAAETIDASNATAEFEKLKKEIDADG